MGSLGEYLISVTGAALVCSGIGCLIDKDKPAYAVVRLVCGIFLLIVMLRPIHQLNVKLPLQAFDSLISEAHAVARDGETTFAETQKTNIKQQLDAYIQNKLSSLKCSLETTLSLQEEFPYAPTQITLRGNVSPYLRSYISSWLHTELNIAPEDQLWIG